MENWDLEEAQWTRLSMVYNWKGLSKSSPLTPSFPRRRGDGVIRSPGSFFPLHIHQVNNNLLTSSLCEKSTNQLRGSCTLGEHETLHTEAGRDIQDTLLPYWAPYLQHSVLVLGENTLISSISLGKERSGPHIQQPNVPRGSPEDLLPLSLSLKADRAQHHPATWGPGSAEMALRHDGPMSQHSANR